MSLRLECNEVIWIYSLGGVQLLLLASKLVGFVERWNLTSDMSMWCVSAMLALLVARTIGKRRHQR